MGHFGVPSACVPNMRPAEKDAQSGDRLTSSVDLAHRDDWNTAVESRHAARVNWLAFGYYLRLVKLDQHAFANPGRWPSSTEAAALLALRPSSFCRWFRKRANVTYTRWASFVRAQVAVELFKSFNADVLNAALAVGYEDPGTFTRAFKRSTGLPPGEYRRRFCQPQPLVQSRHVKDN